MARWIGVLLVIGFLLAPAAAADGFVLAAPITVPVGPGQLRSLVADPSRGVIGIPLDLVHVPLLLFVSEDDACFTGSPEGARDVRERLVAAAEVKIAKTDAVEATITQVSRGQAAGDTRERREDGGRR